MISWIELATRDSGPGFRARVRERYSSDSVTGAYEDLLAPLLKKGP
jgi:hypothetical protein